MASCSFGGFKPLQSILSNELKHLLKPIVTDDVGSEEAIAYN